MYIRDKEAALGALSAILELPTRPAQIVEATVKVALCTDREARDLLLDLQATIIEGGLDALRKRRQDALARLRGTQVRRRAPGVDVRKDPLLEEIGSALDLLKMVRLLAEVFPAAAASHPRWELARFIRGNAGFVREAMEAGLRWRGRPEHGGLEAKLLSKVDDLKPWWPEWAVSIREACRNCLDRLRRLSGPVHPGADDPEILFHVIAMNEGLAQEVLRRLAGTAAELDGFLAGLRARIDLVLSAQEESTP
jgi:hypothetical protein